LADHDHHGGEIWWEKSPHRLCKRDTVSEKLNKAENYPDAKICLPQGNHPECLLPVNGRENSLFFQAKKKQFSIEKCCFFCIGWVLEPRNRAPFKVLEVTRSHILQ
jgi:hypothetical protein